MNNDIATEVFENRREKLRRKMHESGLQALLVSHDANRFYLSGFELHDPQKNESSGLLVIDKDGRDWLCTDPRFFDAARRLWPEERIFIYRGSAAEQVAQLIKDNFSGKIGFEAKSLSVDFHLRLLSVLSVNQELTAADGLIEKLRVIKEPLEIERMARACELNHHLMKVVPSMITVGRTEAQVAWDIEQFFRNHGASELAFDSIVAVGPNAALPHAVPGSDVILENSPVLVDVGCRLDLYCSDQTRTFWVGGKPDPRFTDTMNQVREAQDAAIALLRPGLPISEAYAVAMKVFERHGVERFFTHGLGHGIGLETHEPPSVNPKNSDLLQPGMIITVEPGLYYPEWGGVRWEYMVLITEDGCKVL